MKKRTRRFNRASYGGLRRLSPPYPKQTTPAKTGVGALIRAGERPSSLAPAAQHEAGEAAAALRSLARRMHARGSSNRERNAGALGGKGLSHVAIEPPAPGKVRPPRARQRVVPAPTTTDEEESSILGERGSSEESPMTIAEGPCRSCFVMVPWDEFWNRGNSPRGLSLGVISCLTPIGITHRSMIARPSAWRCCANG